MNQTIARIGSIIVVITVALFAVFMPVSDFGSYVVCIFLALGYLLMIAGFFENFNPICTRNCFEKSASAHSAVGMFSE